MAEARELDRGKEKGSLKSRAKSARPDARGRRGRKASFYEDVLTEGEQMLMSEALDIDGLDGEIALLRVKLQQALVEHPENMEVLMKGVGLLVRAVATQYRLSPKAKGQLTDSIVGVLEGIGESLGLSLNGS
ncbi:MAG: hypothetical protein HW403_1492 [Dehalococcoidia bacterium]|nr:hypothetical protein [Dehalococcoidia bacterium]